MKKHVDKAHTAGRRRIITIIASVSLAVLSGIFFALMQARIPNMHIIFYLILGLSALVVIHLILWTLSANEKYARLVKILKRCYLICISVGLTFFITLQGLIISGSHTDNEEGDCLIVLGAGLRNGAPSLILRRRLNAALTYLQEHDGTPVIVTGGLGRGEATTEAEAMSRYLLERGVDESLIWKEEESRNTKENLTNSVALMAEHGLDAKNARVTVVTSEFHLYRAKLILHKKGINADGIAAQTPGFYLQALYYFREAFALAYELVF